MLGTTLLLMDVFDWKKMNSVWTRNDSNLTWRVYWDSILLKINITQSNYNGIWTSRWAETHEQNMPWTEIKMSVRPQDRVEIDLFSPWYLHFWTPLSVSTCSPSANPFSLSLSPPFHCPYTYLLVSAQIPPKINNIPHITSSSLVLILLLLLLNLVFPTLLPRQFCPNAV